MRARHTQAHDLNPAGILYAARAGLLNDPCDGAQLLADISRRLHEHEPLAAPPQQGAKPQKKKQKKSFAEAKPKTRNKRWLAAEHGLERAQGAQTGKGFSEMLADGMLRDLAPRGHGAKGQRRFNFQAFMAYLLTERDGVGREATRKALASDLMPPNNVLAALAKKRRCNATYKMLDEYRPDFLIKQPSRGEMNAEERRVLAYICANVRAAGPQWAEDESEVEALRRAAVTMLCDEAEAKARNGRLAYCKFVKEEMQKEKAARAGSGGRWQCEAMLAISARWKSSPCNPANDERQTASSGPAAWRAAAAAAAASERADHEAERDTYENRPETYADSAEGAAGAGAAEAGVAEAGAAEAEAAEGVVEATQTAASVPHTQPNAEPVIIPDIEHTVESMQYYRWASVCLLEIGGYETDTDHVFRHAGFITEIGKDSTVPSGFGSHARVALLAAAEAMLASDPLAEVLLITRHQHAPGTDKAGDDFTPTRDARSLFEEVGFTEVRRHDVGGKVSPAATPPCQCYGIGEGQLFMAAPAALLAERLQHVRLRAGAKMLQARQRCRLARGNWWEKSAVAWMAEHHKGTDGALTRDCVQSRDAEALSIFTFVPRAGPCSDRVTETAPPPPAGGAPPTTEEPQSSNLDDYGDLHVDADGTTYRVYDNEVVEGEFASATGRGTVTPSWGDVLAREVMDWLLLQRVRYNVILPAGGEGLARTLRQKFGIKVSLDAAAVRKARKGKKHWTTLIMQVLCQGVDAGHWGKTAVAHMLEKAQSPDYIARVRLWEGKDDHANFEEHVYPLLKQIVELEVTGHDVDALLMPRPPVEILLGDECDDETSATTVHGSRAKRDRQTESGWRHDGLGEGEKAKVQMRDLRGPNGAKGEGGQLDRLALVHAVKMFPSLMVCLDGGTWASASGVSVSSKDRNDFLTNLTRLEQRRPYRWVWMDEGDCVRAWCERKRPGDHTFVTVALMGLARCDNAELAHLTMEKERAHTDANTATAPPAAGGVFSGTAAQQAAVGAGLAATAAAVNTNAESNFDLPYEDEDLENMTPRFDHATFQSPVHDEAQVPLRSGHRGPLGRYGIELPLRERTLVRLPAVPEMPGARLLPDAAWRDLPVIIKSSLCIMHASMRTTEALFTKAVGPLLDGYAKGGAVQTAVDMYLNRSLGSLGARKIATDPKAKACYPASFDGKPAKAWIDDLHRGLVEHAPNLHAPWGLVSCRSRFLKGLAQTYQHLGQGYAGHYDSLVAAVPVLRDYAIAMRSALKMKPTEEDYVLVETHMPRYVIGKLLLWEGSNTWYDNHCLFTIPHMMRKWGSLQLVGQQGMEGWQKQLNDILRLNNGWANAGAIPKEVKRMGERAEDAYLEARKNDKPSSAQWVYEQSLLRQHATWVGTLNEGQKLQGEQDAEMDWERFVLLWQRYLACATLRCWSLARVRVREARRRAFGDQPRAESQTYYYRELLRQHKEYYAPVEVSADDLSTEERERQERTARRERYMRRARYARWDGTTGIAFVAMHPYLKPGERDSRPDRAEDEDDSSEIDEEDSDDALESADESSAEA